MWGLGWLGWLGCPSLLCLSGQSPGAVARWMGQGVSPQELGPLHVPSTSPDPSWHGWRLTGSWGFGSCPREGAHNSAGDLHSTGHLWEGSKVGVDCSPSPALWDQLSKPSLTHIPHPRPQEWVGGP